MEGSPQKATPTGILNLMILDLTSKVGKEATQ